MYRTTRCFTAALVLFLVSWHARGQIPPAPANVTLKSNQRFDSSLLRILSSQNPALAQKIKGRAGTNTAGPIILSNHSNNLKANIQAPLSSGTLPCIDTSNAILTTKTGENIEPGGEILKTRDGGILVPGFHQQNFSPYYLFPYLIKYNASGNILWSKAFDGANMYPQNVANAYKCFELNDGSILMAGQVAIPEAVNGREELVLWRLDANGNLLWVQTDSSSIWWQYAGNLSLSGMVQDPAGNIYLCGDQYVFDAITTHSLVLKMDPAGNISWDKSFSFRGSRCFGILYLGGELSVYGVNPFVYLPNGSGQQTNCVWNLRMNPATGDTLRSKCWYADYGANSGWNSILNYSSIQLLTNGHIAVFGNALADYSYGVTPIVHAITAEFDPSFNFLRGWMVESNLLTNISNTRITEHASGRVSFTSIPYLTGYNKPVIFGTIENGQFIKQRVLEQSNLGNNWSTNFVNTSPNEDIDVLGIVDQTTNAVDIEFLRFHDSDTSSVCMGRDTSINWLEPYAMLPFPRYYCDSVSSNTFRRTNRMIPSPADGDQQQQSACKLPSFCDSIKVSVNLPVVCAGQPLVFTCRRNPECGSRPVWLFDSNNLQSDTVLNDTTLVLMYKDQNQGKVSVSMHGTCRSLSDSIDFQVLSAGKSVSLGPDDYLCPDSVLVLRPAKGFGNYVWQDGSSADTLLVTSPGKYYITVTNTCGLPISDTILIQQATALNFFVGPDTSVCLNEQITINAPDGYNNYSWKADNNANSFFQQSLTINPLRSTKYTAYAQTLQGCFVKDSLMVTVNIPNTVYLGSDTSFCSGDSVLLNAGYNFLNYNWNTGSSDISIWVRSQGTYSVSVQSPNGCYSNDTMTVKNVYALPVVDLGKDGWLCEGTFRVLNAGNNYVSYLWQNGATSTTSVADTTGIYWVQVKDNHGCSSGDTTVISTVIPKATGFLMQDTLICDGYPTKIQSSGQFYSYTWSTGEKEDFITVRKKGNYTLVVTDQYGCSSTAAIDVETKQCLFGMFFPNAFSPNRDGVNDVYRPTVLGNLTKYRLQIFNRWGQKIFESEDFTKGWDATLGNMTQPEGTYVWLCSYQFSGEPEKTQRGSLVLIR